MNLHLLLEKAIFIALRAHRGQFDKGGNLYILHPLAVMNRVKTLEEKIVAVLHDVIEDTNVTVKELEEEGFPPYIIAALLSVTRNEDETYFEFIKRCIQNKIGRIVKLADIKENLDFSRIPNPTEEQIIAYKNREKRYIKAEKMILESIQKEKQGTI